MREYQAPSLELIDVHGIETSESKVSEVLQKQIKEIVLSGIYSDIKRMSYYPVVKCMVENNSIVFKSLGETVPVISAVERYGGKVIVATDVHIIDPTFSEEKDSGISITPLVLADALLYSTVLGKTMMVTINPEKSKELLHSAYLPITDIYFSLIFFMLRKEYGLSELNPIELGILKFLFSKYIAQTWFGLDIHQATFSYAIQAVLASRILSASSRVNFIEIIKNKKLDDFDASTLTNIFHYISTTRLIPDITLEKFKRIIYLKHQLYNLIAFERLHYFITTCVAARYTRKLPISYFFAQVNKHSLKTLLTSVDKTIMSKPLFGGC